MSEVKPPLGMIRRICPRHNRLEDPGRHSRPKDVHSMAVIDDPSVEWVTTYELSCISCRFEEMFRGTPPALAPRTITEEQYNTMAAARGGREQA